MEVTLRDASVFQDKWAGKSTKDLPRVFEEALRKLPSVERDLAAINGGLADILQTERQQDLKSNQLSPLGRQAHKTYKKLFASKNAKTNDMIADNLRSRANKLIKKFELIRSQVGLPSDWAMYNAEDVFHPMPTKGFSKVESIKRERGKAISPDSMPPLPANRTSGLEESITESGGQHYISAPRAKVASIKISFNNPSEATTSEDLGF